MDDRTYPRDHQHADALSSALAEVARLRAKNERLTSELTLRIRELVDANRELKAHRDERPRLLRANARLSANAAELSKALDMALAERKAAYAEVDAQTLKANSFRSELHRYVVHARELKEMLDISVAERDTLRDKLTDVLTAFNLCDAMREDAEREHAKVSRIAEGLAQDLATERANMRTAQATIDAMRQAHSVIAGRLAGLGWWC